MITNPFSQTVAEAMTKPHVVMVLAAAIYFDSGTSYVHTGVGEILIDGNIFIGIGDLSEVGSVKEQNTTSASQVALTLSGLSQFLLATSLNEPVVNRRITTYVAVLDEFHTSVAWNILSKGVVTSTQAVLGEENAVTYNISNVFEKWAKGRPYRYTDESHQRRHPADRFFRYISQMAERSLFWGSKKDAPGFRYDN